MNYQPNPHDSTTAKEVHIESIETAIASIQSSMVQEIQQLNQASSLVTVHLLDQSLALVRPG